MSTLVELAGVELAPPLKWAGGKRWLVPRLAALWSQHSHRRLVEPFCGGLSVSLGLRPVEALVNDINPHLMSFYRWLRRGLVIELPMENDEALYYEHRDRFNDLIVSGHWGSAEAAGLFYFLNRTGYNGLCRFNASGGYNVPFGRYKTINYRTDFADYRAALAGWSFACGDFARLELRPSDFIYADPPYDVPFTHYSQGGFDWADQQRTAQWLAQHTGPVVLSNQATPRIVDLYDSLGYRVEYVDAPRRIACTGDRQPAREVLATRNV